MLFWSSDTDAGDGDRERGISEYKVVAPMQSTMNNIRRVVNPRLCMSAGQERALLEAYCDVFGGREAADARYTGAAYLLPLRAAARAQLARAPKAKVIALYQTYLAEVIASYPNDEDRRTLADVSLEEQHANLQLDCSQITLGAHPTVPQLLTADHAARRQIAATHSMREKIARLLGGAQR